MFLADAPFSLWSTWGIGLEALFTAIGLTFVAAGVLLQGSIKARLADLFMVTSLLLGLCTFVFLGFTTLGYQENLSFCRDYAMGFFWAQNRCLAGQAQGWLAAVFGVNRFTLGVAFFGSWNCVRKPKAP